MVSAFNLHASLNKVANNPISKDVAQATGGNTGLRAFRLSTAFAEAHKTGKFSTQGYESTHIPTIKRTHLSFANRLADHRLTFASILQELPVNVRNSPLLNAFLGTLTRPTVPTSLFTNTSTLTFNSFPQTAALPPSFTTLDLPASNTLSRAMESVLETLDAYKTEESNLAYLSRQIAREKARADMYIAKRKEENASRVAQGLVPLPEDDVSRLFKMPPEPNRLESVLLLGQLDGYSRSLEGMASSELVKMYAAQSKT